MESRFDVQLGKATEEKALAERKLRETEEEKKRSIEKLKAQIDNLRDNTLVGEKDKEIEELKVELETMKEIGIRLKVSVR